MTQLPPGQRKVDGFPRFGGPAKPPTVPASPALEIAGAIREPVTVALSELSTLPRTAARPPRNPPPCGPEGWWPCPAAPNLEAGFVAGLRGGVLGWWRSRLR